MNDADWRTRAKRILRDMKAAREARSAYERSRDERRKDLHFERLGRERALVEARQFHGYRDGATRTAAIERAEANLASVTDELRQHEEATARNAPSYDGHLSARCEDVARILELR